MSIILGSNELHYKIKGNKYIITFISNYNANIDNYLEQIYNLIYPNYASKKLDYSNTCGANAEFICNYLKIDQIKVGKLIINNWAEINSVYLNNLEKIENVYGPIYSTIRGTYHALVYLEINENKKYHVAIETTSCEPYKLQFYIGNDMTEFEKIITTRYQCNNFKISFDCDKSWLDIARNGGKKKQKTSKRRARKWSLKYKKSINCARPKGFSQKQYCKYGRTRKQV
jgi:hypothetical protein